MQTWKLFKEDRLLDIVDPDIDDCREDQIKRFMKVALFCTQAASQQRPDMKQVMKMLSTDVILNEKVLTEPGLFRPQGSSKSGGDSFLVSSLSDKGKESVTQFVTSAEFDDNITDMIPR